MPIFEIEGPDGVYEVDAPDETRAISAFKKMQGQSQPQNDWSSTLGDVAASGASGIARGAADLVGLPGTISDLMKSGGNWAMRKGYEAATGEEPQPGTFFAGPDPEIAAKVGAYSPFSGAKAREGLSAVTGGASAYEPKTTAGEYASTIGEFIPGAAAFGGLNPSNIARFGVLPGAASEAAGQATEGTAAEPYARVAAALLAPSAVSLARKAITPFGVSPERSAAAAALRKEGVRPTAGQVTGSRGLRFRESELGGGKAADIIEKQGEQFTKAALKRAGIDAERATPDVMSKGLKAIGDKFDDLATRTTVQFDNTLQNDLLADVVSYQQNATAVAPVVENMANRIAEIAANNGGVVPGSAYKTLRSDIGAASARASDNGVKWALRDLQESLDDAVSRSMPPDILPAWQSARGQYRNYLTLERAATGAGEDAALGIISPSKLRQATVTTQGRRNYATGKGDFEELARSGEALLKPLPNSGTAARIDARTIGGLLGATGAGTGALAAGPAGAVAGLAAGAAVPFVAGRALMSAPVQSYLANQLLSPSRLSDPRLAAVVEALISQQSVAQEKTGRLPSQ